MVNRYYVGVWEEDESEYDLWESGHYDLALLIPFEDDLRTTEYGFHLLQVV